MYLPSSSDSSVKDMILGVEITVFGFLFAYRYSSVIGDLIVLAGIWITISGYYSDEGTDRA